MANTKMDIKIGQTIAKYAASHYFRQFFNLFLAFLRPKLLDPELFGLWNLLKIIPEYTSYAQLGARSSLRFTIPKILSSSSTDNELKISRIISAGYWGALLPNIFCFSLLVIGATNSSLSTMERSGLACMAVISLLAWRYNHSMALLKSYREFPLITKNNIYCTLIKFISTISFIYLFGIYGCYLTEALTLIFAIIFIKLNFKEVKISKFHFPSYKKLINIGFPLMLLDVVELLIRTSDRYVIAWYGDTKMVGYYGLAIMLAGFMLNLPGASREVIEAELMYSWQENQKLTLFKKYTLQPMVNTAYLVPILIGASVFLLPTFIHLLLPTYKQGILSAQIISFAGFFMALSFGTRGIIVALNKQTQAALITIPVAIINVFLSSWAMLNGFSLAGVALATTFTFVLHFTILYLFVALILKISAKEIMKGFFSTFFPFIYMSASLAAIYYAGQNVHLAIWLKASLQFIIYLLSIVALLAFGQNNHSIKGPWRKKNDQTI